MGVTTGRDDVAAPRDGQPADSRAARLLERMTDAHMVLDRDFRVVYANPASERVLGVRKESFLGKTHWEAWPASAGSELERRYRRVARDGVDAHFTNHYVGEGYDIHLEIDAYPTDEGGVAVFWRDVSDQIRGEAALRESEAKYRTLFESIDEGFCVVEVLFDDAGTAVDHRFLEANPAFEKQSGLTNVVGKRMRELAPAHESHWFELFGAVAATGEPRRFEARADALGRWFDVFALRVGRPEECRVAVLFTDVTASRRAHADVEAARAEAEAAHRRVEFLAEASARLASSLDVAATLRTVAELAVPTLADWCFVEVREDDGAIRPMAVTHTDPAMVALAQEGLRRYPIDPEAPFGTGHVLRTGEPELAPEIGDEILRSVAQDAEHLALLRRVGFRSSLSVPLRDPEGHPVAVLSLVSAESGRRFGPADLAMAEEVARRAGAALASARLYAAEQAALRRATALQRVTAALSSAITAEQAAAVVVEQSTEALSARGGVVLRVADDGARLDVVQAVGYEAEALDEWRRIPTDGPVPLAEAVRTREPIFIDSAAHWEGRYGTSSLLRRLPETCSWAALPLVAEGRVLGAMGLSFSREGPLGAADRAFAVSLAQQCAQAFERARLFHAEREAREEAERANRAKSEFLAVMSHELRTPLNAIGGYAELMEMGIRGPVTAQQAEDLRRIQTSQRHLLGLINEVLNYARLETGTVHYDVTTIRLREALVGAEALVAPQAQAKELALALADSPAGLVVRADAEKLRQILVNLLSNAVKFTDRGGRIEVACAAGDDVARVLVRDTGIGIPADKLESIFEPFVQVRAELTRTAEGTGLGLAISRDLARGMGGELTVESELGRGSTFTLVLPRA